MQHLPLGQILNWRKRYKGHFGNTWGYWNTYKFSTWNYIMLQLLKVVSELLSHSHALVLEKQMMNIQA